MLQAMYGMLAILNPTLISYMPTFQHQLLRLAKLEAMYEVLGDPAITLKSNTDIRWLSLNNAIQALYATFSSVVAYYTRGC